jgi:SAM-dependent methyltransferase
MTMGLAVKNIPLVMPLEGIPSYRWILDDHILQATINRFVGNPNFCLLIPETYTARLIAGRLLREIPSLKDKIFAGASGQWGPLLQMADRANADRIMVLPENACGMPAAAVDLAAEIVARNDSNLLYSDQIVGLVPWVLSRTFLLQASNGTAASAERLPRLSLRPGAALPAWGTSLLWTRLGQKQITARDPLCERLLEIPKDCDRIHNVRFLQDSGATESIYYLPRLERDRALAHYLVEKTLALDKILRSVTDLPASGSSSLAAYIKEFCDTFAVTYPTYRLTGEPDIPEEIRGLTSNPKSVGTCYLGAINFTKFLKTYAGLKNTSRVLDIGCGWGSLALGLVNLTEEPGSYLGLDIQKKAIMWAQKNIAPLNPRFSFLHLDIANTRYNPEGAIPHDRVQLPIESESIDLVALSSVFTHMRREAMEQYLRESRRVLKQEGIVAFSYFHSSFFGKNQDYMVRFPDNPDRMTLFSTHEIRRILLSCGLVQARPQVNYGGRFNSEGPFFQTFMFATKR